MKIFFLHLLLFSLFAFTDFGQAWSPKAIGVLPAVYSNLGETWTEEDATTWVFAPAFLTPEYGWMSCRGGNATAPTLFKWTGGPLTDRLYVDQSATGDGSGTTWVNAFTGLQAALATAEAGDEIWVAEGVYLPGDNPASTFLIDKKLHLYGGFAGTEYMLSERDIEQHPTILSGDLNGDDIPNNFDTLREDNSYRVVWVYESVSEGASMDGFTIKNGHAIGSSNDYRAGGGIRMDGAMQISHCTFEQNFAFSEGGAVACFQPSTGVVRFKFCNFENNRSNLGGGLAVRFREVHFEDCSFSGNKTMDSGIVLAKSGSAIFVHNSNSTFKRCSFTANEAEGTAALFFWVDDEGEGFTVEVDSCLFSNNIASTHGALISQTFGKNTSTQLTNSTFLNNRTTGMGQYGTVSIYNWKPGSYGNALVDNCHFEGNSAWSTGALDIGSGTDAAPSSYIISNSSFINNSCEQNGGALDLWSEVNTKADFHVENCYFEGNQSGAHAGALWIDTGSDAFFANVSHCVFINNNSVAGSAIGSSRDLITPATPTSAQLKLDNCFMANNNGEQAAIVVTDLVNLELINCTIADNTPGGIALDTTSTLTLQNNILYNNGDMEFQALNDESTVTSNGGNLIGDGSLAAHAHPYDQQNADPLFAGTDDFRLTENSPAVDAGVDSGDVPDTDLAGNQRIVNCIDIGAYESEFMVVMQCLTDSREVIVGKMEFFPNPATAFIRIQLPENVSGPIALQFFDAQGRLVQQETATAGQEVNVEGLASGMYIVKGVIGNKVYIGRFVKE